MFNNFIIFIFIFCLKKAALGSLKKGLAFLIFESYRNTDKKNGFISNPSLMRSLFRRSGFGVSRESGDDGDNAGPKVLEIKMYLRI